MFTFLMRVFPDRAIQGLTRTYFTVKAIHTKGLRQNHCSQVSLRLHKMKVTILPALSDNYMYLITDEKTKQAAVVDPVAPDTVLEAVAAEGVNLTKILTTHHHWDHAGGNEELVKKATNPLQVYGGDKRIGALTNEVKHGDTFTIGSINVECIHTPCHTSGHMCYYLTAPGQDPVVFTGDTLFVAGCGRFFEGTAEQMYSALIDKLGALPDNTLVFCGHEYTIQNLKFSRHVEGDNPHILKAMDVAEEKRQKGLPTVPSTIGDERRINPFMRVMMGSVQRHSSCSDAIKTMHAIRKEKDNFSG